ncbi:unnamed protein product, partial [Ectocarpus sp. 13 AM-2016]
MLSASRGARRLQGHDGLPERDRGPRSRQRHPPAAPGRLRRVSPSGPGFLLFRAVLRQECRRGAGRVGGDPQRGRDGRALPDHRRRTRAHLSGESLGSVLPDGAVASEPEEGLQGHGRAVASGYRRERRAQMGLHQQPGRGGRASQRRGCCSARGRGG